MIIREEFEDAERIIRIRKSKKDKQCNGQMKKDKQRSTNITLKTKYWATWTPLNTGGEHVCFGKVSSCWSTYVIRRVTLITNPVIIYEWGKNLIVITTNRTYVWSFVTQT